MKLVPLIILLVSSALLITVVIYYSVNSVNKSVPSITLGALSKSYNPTPVYHPDLTNWNAGDWNKQAFYDYQMTQGCVGYSPCNVVNSSDGMHILFNGKGCDVQFPYPDLWYSGRVYGNQVFGYGLFSVCATLPKGPLLWPAIWMLGNRSSQWPQQGEIDIMESIGTGATAGTNDLYGTVHFNTAGGGAQAPGVNQNKYGTVDVTKGPYSFAVEWQADQITWYYWADPKMENMPLDANGNLRTDINIVKGNTLDLTQLIAGCGGNADCMQAFNATNNQYKFLFNITVGGQWAGSQTPSCSWAQNCASCPGVPVQTEMIIHDIKVFYSQG